MSECKKVYDEQILIPKTAAETVVMKGNETGDRMTQSWGSRVKYLEQ